LPRLIRASFVASHSIYGAPRVFLDLREAGETCSKHPVARLMRQAEPSSAATPGGDSAAPTVWSEHEQEGNCWDNAVAESFFSS
jgi:transposase InsO family protein